MDKILNDLLSCLEKSDKQYDKELIIKAYEFAKASHQGQMRVSGEEYIIHPASVAMLLIELGMDMESLISALLHDVVEDTGVTQEEVTNLFGRDVAILVSGVTKLGKIPYSSREEQQAENIRKMLLAMSQDIRVIIIKLADRLHNMRTIDAMPPQKQRDKSLETMEVYAPIAHRLGIRAFKEELEDLSLKHLDGIAYAEIDSALTLHKEERARFLNNIMRRINERIAAENMQIFLEGRVKSIYGIYRKVYIQGKSFEEIYDIYAVRIIVDTVIDCYNILGVIHDMFTPIPNRFKDYISTPKPNMYQSLHTTVIDKEGVPFEIQIRTWEMHHTAEYGIAADWKYKAGMQGKDKLEDRLAWIRKLLESQSEDVEEIVRTIKTDLSPEDVFVFTPKGDVKTLPAGSTVIDFAFAIHSEVGNRMIGAKVDGRMVSIDSEVKTGQIVDIITSNTPGRGPSRDWLKIVKTSEAKSKIRSWFKKERREENISEGREEIEREFRRNAIRVPDEEYNKFIEDLAKRQHCAGVDEFYAAIGYGGISLSKIMPRIKDDYIKQYKPVEPTVQSATKKRSKTVSGGVVVEDIDGCLVKFAQCCNPLPGDDITGFVTRGYGVSVHKRDCVNVIASQESGDQPERWVNVQWSDEVKETFKSTIEILARDRAGMIADVTVALSNMHLPIHELNARELKDGYVGIHVTIGISGREQLQNVMTNLNRIDSVSSVTRTGK